MLDSTSVALIGVFLLLGLLAIGMPIGFTMALAGFIGIVLMAGFDVAISSLFTLPWGFLADYTWVVAILFIMMGIFASHSGIMGNLYTVVNNWLGRLRGGLAIATVIGCAIFGAISGSSIVTVAAIGPIAVPMMKRYGYDTKLTLGSVAASGTLAILIPPSIPMVVYAVLSGESVGKCLLAGLLPGILSSLLYAVMIFLRCFFNPKLGPAATSTPWKTTLKTTGQLWPVLLMSAVVLGGMYSGLATATEAAGLGASIAFLFLLAKLVRKTEGSKLIAFKETTMAFGTIFTIFIGASIYVGMLVLTRTPAAISEYLVVLQVGIPLKLAFIIGLLLILGMFLESISILLITVPILYPAVIGMGFDGIWFAVIMTKTIEIGLLTPPVGLNCYVLKAVVPENSLDEIFAGIWPFVAVDIISLILLMVFPQISLVLPRMMTK